MKRRTTACLLSACMALSMLAGCGKGQETGRPGQEETPSTEAVEPSGETTEAAFLPSTGRDLDPFSLCSK